MIKKTQHGVALIISLGGGAGIDAKMAFSPVLSIINDLNETGTEPGGVFLFCSLQSLQIMEGNGEVKQTITRYIISHTGFGPF